MTTREKRSRELTRAAQRKHDGRTVSDILRLLHLKPPTQKPGQQKAQTRKGKAAK
jgi:hypothetical protein